jgi:hypothetical protein
VSLANDDTQPRSPLKDLPRDQQPTLNPPAEPDYDGDGDGLAGPGCAVWGLLGVVIFGMAALIVGLAAAAGWTEGSRRADDDARATQAEIINQQLLRIPTDAAMLNHNLLFERVAYLERVTPGVSGLDQIRATATAVYLTAQPTITPTVTPTPTPSPTTSAVEAVDATEEAFPTAENASGYDLSALLNEAQEQFNLGEYDEAIETLQVIIDIDDTFARSTVRDLMFRALTTQARALYSSVDTIAEAIIVTNQADDYGDVGDLDYERFIGGLYLDAQARIALGNPTGAIQALLQIYNQQTTYKGIDIGRELFNQYVAYGDALRQQGSPCAAVNQYDNALRLFSDAVISGQRDTAQTFCEQGTPTPGVGTDGSPVAPVGQPGG